MAPFYLPYDRLKYLAIAVCCYPLANTYLQEQRLKKIRQLQVFLLRDEENTDFIRSVRARSLEGGRARREHPRTRHPRTQKHEPLTLAPNPNPNPKTLNPQTRSPKTLYFKTPNPGPNPSPNPNPNSNPNPNPNPNTLNPQNSKILCSKPSTLKLEDSKTLYPTPYALRPKHLTLNPKSETEPPKPSPP